MLLPIAESFTVASPDSSVFASFASPAVVALLLVNGRVLLSRSGSDDTVDDTVDDAVEIDDADAKAGCLKGCSVSYSTTRSSS